MEDLAGQEDELQKYKELCKDYQKVKVRKSPHVISGIINSR